MAELDDLESVRPKRGGTIVVIILVLAVAGGAAFGVRYYTQHTGHGMALQNAANSVQAFKRCLLGPPLEQGETVIWRVHRMELNRDPTSGGNDVADLSRRWPMRCAAHATTVRDAMRSIPSATPQQRRLADAAERTRTGLTRGFTETEGERRGEPSHLELFFTAATAAQLPQPNAPATGPLPPEAMSPVTRRDLTPLFTSAIHDPVRVLGTDRTTGTSLHVLFAQGGLYGCRFISSTDEAQHLTRATCSQLANAQPSVAAGDVAMFDVDDDYLSFPPVRIGVGRDANIVGLPGTTAPRNVPFAVRGYLATSGRAWVLETNNVEVDEAAETGNWRIARLGPGTQVVRAPMRLPEGSSRPELLPDRVIYLSPSDPAHGPARVGLFGRRLQDSAPIALNAVDAGDVADESRIVARCRTAAGAIAVLTGTDRASTVTLTAGPGWAPPARFVRGLRSATCGIGDLIALNVGTAPTILRVARCGLTGCAATEARIQSALSSILTRSAGADFAILEDRILVVWTPTEGGLRMRLAPLDAIDQARDRVIYDDHGHRGGWVQVPTIHVRGRVAVVTFADNDSQTDGPRPVAIRISRDGVVQAVQLQAGP